jgi:hypothetical protein
MNAKKVFEIVPEEFYPLESFVCRSAESKDYVCELPIYYSRRKKTMPICFPWKNPIL